MKKIHYTLYILFSIFLTSCSDQDLDGFIANNILYFLNTSSDNIIVAPIEETHKVDVTANTDWSAKTESSWIVIDKPVDDNKTEFSFRTLDNDTPNERIGTIGIYYFGKLKRNITIRQRAVSLNTITESLSYSSLSTEQNIVFTTEGSWSIESSAEWIKPSETQGFGNATVSIAVDELMSAKDREGIISIYDQALQKKEIRINQKGKYLIPSTLSCSFLATGENIEKLDLKTDGSIEYSCDPWIKISNLNNGHSAKISVTQNDTGKTKNGFVYLTLKNVYDFEPLKISIRQAPVKTTAQAVDLGLSVKWASLNIGATDEYQVGDYYIYGDSFDNPLDPYDYYAAYHNSIPKCVFNTPYDTANSYWGGHWRIPTKEEWDELIQNCNITLIDLQEPQTIVVHNTECGYKTSYIINHAYVLRNNNNRIILPIAGCWRHASNVNIERASKIRTDCAYHINTGNDGQRFGYQDPSTGKVTYSFFVNNPIIITNNGCSHFKEDEDYREEFFPYFAPIRAVWDE